MKPLALVAALFISASALADADLAYLSLTTDRTQVMTGERYRVTARIRNNGPDAAAQARVTITQDLTGFFLDVSAPAGWTCTPAWYASGLSCTNPSFAAGAEAEITAIALAPAAPTTRHTLGGMVLHAGRDPVPANINAAANVAVISAPTIADLTLGFARDLQIAPAATATHQVQVTNNGPDEARDVAVVMNFVGSTPAAMTARGSGWRCEAVTAERMVCTRPRLAPHASAPIDLTLTAPGTDQILSLHIAAIAEMNRDPEYRMGNTAVFVGAAENWRRFLLPTGGDRIPGANGALWRTDVRMLIHSDTPVEIRPHNCDFSVIPECFLTDPPLRTEFDPRQRNMLLEDTTGNGQFIYVRAADFEKVRINARVYDAARQTETAGAELPVPRDTEFTSGPIDLLNIPVAPQYRHTLRVYDFDGRRGTRVLIRVYAGTEMQPRVTTEAVLTRPESGHLTTARLPPHPAFVQLTLGQLLPLDGIRTMRVEVTPLDPSTRLWSFVSITNNDTHHVTTVSPQ